MTEWLNNSKESNNEGLNWNDGNGNGAMRGSEFHWYLEQKAPMWENKMAEEQVDVE